MTPLETNHVTTKIPILISSAFLTKPEITGYYFFVILIIYLDSQGQNLTPQKLNSLKSTFSKGGKSNIVVTFSPTFFTVIVSRQAL